VIGVGRMLTADYRGARRETQTRWTRG
jgi:hypothetical protein